MAYLQQRTRKLTGTATKIQEGNYGIRQPNAALSRLNLSGQFDQEMKNGKSLKERIEEKAKELIELEKKEGDACDIFGIKIMRTAAWNSTDKSTPEIIKEADTVMIKEQKMRSFQTLLEMNNKNRPDKGGVVYMGLHLHGASNAAARFGGAVALALENVANGIDIAKLKLEKLEGRLTKGTKSAGASDDIKDKKDAKEKKGHQHEDEEINEINMDLKQQINNIREQIESAVAEKAVVESIMSTEEGLNAILIDDEVKDMVIDSKLFESVVTMLQEGDYLGLQMVITRTDDKSIITDAIRAMKQPLMDDADGFNKTFGIPIGCTSMMKRILDTKYASYEEYTKLKRKLVEWYIDFDKIGKGGLKGQMDELEKIYDKVSALGETLADTDPGNHHGLPNQLEHLYWIALPKLHQSKNENPTVEGANALAVQQAVLRIYTDAKKEQGTPGEKFKLLMTALKSEDELNVDTYIKYQKKETRDWTLNVQERGKGRGGKGIIGTGGKGKGGGGKGTCGNQARKGFCTKVGCGYQGLTPEQYKMRGDCRAEKTKEGCKYFACRYKHSTDPPIINNEMMSKCVHQRGKGNINQAEEADEVDVIMNGEDELVVVIGQEKKTI